jgi:hypothetical protein
MKKAFIIAFISIAFLIVSNVYYYLDTYQWQIDTQEDILQKQSSMVCDRIEQFASKTKTGISILFSQAELDSLFQLKGESVEVQKRLQLLYNGFSERLNEIVIYDTKGNSYELIKSDGGSFISAFGHAKVDNVKSARMLINPHGTRILYVQPLVSNEETIGYVRFDMDLEKFFSSAFYNFNVENVNFQWVMKPNGDVVYNTLEQGRFYPEINAITDHIGEKEWFSDVHNIQIGSEDLNVLTVFR